MLEFELDPGEIDALLGQEGGGVGGVRGADLRERERAFTEGALISGFSRLGDLWRLSLKEPSTFEGTDSLTCY